MVSESIIAGIVAPEDALQLMKQAERMQNNEIRKLNIALHNMMNRTITIVDCQEFPKERGSAFRYFRAIINSECENS